MAIQRHFTFDIAGAKFTVQKKNDLPSWVVLDQQVGKNLQEQIDYLVPLIVSVEGLAFDDGQEITLEEVKAKTAPAEIYPQLISAWLNATVALIKGEASSKNG